MFDYTKFNNIEWFGDFKIRLIDQINKIDNREYDKKTRPDVLLRVVCSQMNIDLDFNITRKNSKKILKYLSCFDCVDINSVRESIRMVRESPDQVEIESLKKRMDTSGYDLLTKRDSCNVHVEHVVSIALSKNFYQSREWKSARYQAFRIYKNYCQCCGRKRSENVWLEVDHIKPKSLAPELALDISNLQILCMDCNAGKSNLDCTDWRD